MALPVINVPTYDLKLVSRDQVVQYRPFLVKEEKLLLMALEGGEQADMFRAIKAILKSCIITEDVDVDGLPQFDIEHLFLNIRGKSVGETIELKLKHTDGVNSKGDKCGHIQDVTVDIDDIKVDSSDAIDSKIKLTDEIGVVLNYPTLEILDILGDNKDRIESVFQLVIGCIHQIWDAKSVYEASDHTSKELLDFLESLSKSQFEKITEFFESMPKLKHTITYKCEDCGVEESMVMEGMQSFFN
tara:strand:- start:1020 stop:1751 length:732 start_codon:yes stop_codon:yes gene_type:complete